LPLIVFIATWHTSLSPRNTRCGDEKTGKQSRSPNHLPPSHPIVKSIHIVTDSDPQPPTAAPGHGRPAEPSRPPQAASAAEQPAAPVVTWRTSRVHIHGANLLSGQQGKKREGTKCASATGQIRQTKGVFFFKKELVPAQPDGIYGKKAKKE